MCLGDGGLLRCPARPSVCVSAPKPVPFHCTRCTGVQARRNPAVVEEVFFGPTNSRELVGTVTNA